MIARPTIICSGAATLDTVFRLDALPAGPGKILARDAVEVAHGMASSAAAAIARLGARSILFARVGEDAQGTRITDDLSAAGVDCTHVRRVPGARSAVCAVLVDKEGERLVIPWYDPRLGAETDWLPLGLIAEADAVLVDVRWPEGATKVLGAARAAKIPAILDADVGPVPVIENLVALSSHAVFSEPAAQKVSGASGLEDAVRALARKFKGFIAVTGGERGCFWFERETGTVLNLAPPRVEAVDTLAAGDVFHGAFALAVAEKKSIPEAVTFANAAAALKCTIFGGRLGAPSREAVEKLL